MFMFTLTGFNLTGFCATQSGPNLGNRGLIPYNHKGAMFPVNTGPVYCTSLAPQIFLTYTPNPTHLPQNTGYSRRCNSERRTAGLVLMVLNAFSSYNKPRYVVTFKCSQLIFVLCHHHQKVSALSAQFKKSKIL